MPFPIPPNEDARLEALRRYGLLDTSSEKSFDDFTYIASQICDTPIAFITLIDAHRQWFKSKVGFAAGETPREHAFCAHAIMEPRVMIVEDATADSRFAANPLVTSEPHIRFYAGAPLVDSEGFGLGTLCVIDRQPRQLSPTQQATLEALARQVVSLFEFRRVSADLAKALSEMKILRGLLPICAHCKAIRNDQGYWREIEDYIATHSDADFTHCICPACLKTHFPEVHARLPTQGKPPA